MFARFPRHASPLLHNLPAADAGLLPLEAALGRIRTCAGQAIAAFLRPGPGLDLKLAFGSGGVGARAVLEGWLAGSGWPVLAVARRKDIAGADGARENKFAWTTLDGQRVAVECSKSNDRKFDADGGFGGPRAAGGFRMQAIRRALTAGRPAEAG